MSVQVDWNAQLVIGLKKGDAKIVRTALEKGADKEHLFWHQSEYTTPLRFAIDRASVELTKILLEAGAKIKTPRSDLRQVAEFLCRQNPANTNGKAVFNLLNTTQHQRVFAEALVQTDENTAANVSSSFTPRRGS